MIVKIIIAYLLIILLALSLTGCSPKDFPTPEQSLQQFIEHWNNSNYEDMYDYLSAAAKTSHTEEVFTTRYKNISDALAITSLELRDITVQKNANNIIDVNYTLDYFTNTVPQFSHTYTASLEKGESHWFLNWEQSLILPNLTPEDTVKVTRQFPKRGAITDRNQTPLAYQGAIREIGVVPGKIYHEAILLSGLSELLQMNPDGIKKLYTQSWVKPDMFVPIKKISEVHWQQNRENFLALKGIMINTREGRVYDFPHSIGQTIGYISEISTEKLEQMRPQGYRAGDLIGTAGIEELFETELAGTIGFTVTIQNQAGEAVHLVAEQKSIDGSNLVTTLDKRLLDVVDGGIGRHTGAAVLLDAKSGELLAISSKPGFNSNLFALGITQRQYLDLQALNSPFVNRALTALLPPGSVFKPFTALMALHENVFDPTYAWDTPSQWQKSASWGGYHVTRVDRPTGAVDLTKAMKYSDNVYFADVSLKVGWDNFNKHAVKMGFNTAIPLILPSQISQVAKSELQDVLLADSGFGQGELLATPLHLALMYAAIARGDGNIPVPQILSNQAPSVWLETGFYQEDLAQIDQTLQAAVGDPDALANFASIPGKLIKGKTGTSEVTENRQIGWFVCYVGDYVLAIALDGDRTMTSRQAMQAARIILEYGL